MKRQVRYSIFAIKSAFQVIFNLRKAKREFTVEALDWDQHLPAPLREFDGVGQEVGDDLCEPVRVGIDLDSAAPKALCTT